VAELDIKRALQHFLNQSLKIRLTERLLSYCLFNISVYLLLLIVLVLFDASLLLVSLLIYCSLSLLPVFLFSGREGDLFNRTVRQIDEHCQLEAYLKTRSPEHRTFMHRRVEDTLVRRMNERTIRFRFSRLHMFLAALGILLILVLQVSSYLRFYSLTPSLSAQELKKRLGERFVGEEPPLPPISDEIADGSTPEQESRRGIAQGELSERRAAGEVEGTELEDLPAGSATRQMPGFEQKEGSEQRPPEEGEDYERVLVPLPQSDSIFQQLLQEGARESEQIAREGSGAEAGSSGAGRAFKDSPLFNYQSSPERITVEGSTEELATAQTLTETRRQAFLNTVFSSFAPKIRITSTFDPLIEAIRERYQELIVERF